VDGQYLSVESVFRICWQFYGIKDVSTWINNNFSGGNEMPSSLVTILIVALICLILGAIAGLLLGSQRSEETESEAGVVKAPPGGESGHYEAIARLWREKNRQILMIEMNGKTYVSPDPLNFEQRDLLKRAALELARWIGVSPTPVAARVATEQGAATPQAVIQEASPVTPVTNVSIDLPAPAAPPVIPAQQEPKAPVVQPVTQPAARYFAPLVAPFKAEASPKKAEAKVPVLVETRSIVAQIDEVLKEISEGTAYASQGISISEDPRRGVIVWIGTTSYEGIDGVTDPEAQKLLRAAVAEWERRQDQAKVRK
jgi:hypothetical protein